VSGLFAIPFGALALPSTFSGCATQETNPAPDAAPAPCNPGPFIFCSVVAPDVPGCNTDDGTSRFLTRLPRATRYGVGCVVNYVGARDEQGDCKNEAVCKCLLTDVIVPAVPDAGSLDGAAPPPPSPTPAAPAWNCSPP
jgi:hypothetical protein